MEPVELSFTLTQDDYARAMRGFSLRQPIYVILTIVIAALVVVFVCISSLLGLVNSSPGQPFPGATGWLILILFPCLAVLAPAQFFVIRPYLTARRYAKQQDKVGRITWVVDDDQIRTQSEQSKSEMAWSVFERAFENREYYFVVYALNRLMFQIVPKRALNAETETAFRHYVERHLGPIK